MADPSTAAHPSLNPHHSACIELAARAHETIAEERIRYFFERNDIDFDDAVEERLNLDMDPTYKLLLYTEPPVAQFWKTKSRYEWVDPHLLPAVHNPFRCKSDLKRKFDMQLEEVRQAERHVLRRLQRFLTGGSSVGELELHRQAGTIWEPSLIAADHNACAHGRVNTAAAWQDVLTVWDTVPAADWSESTVTHAIGNLNLSTIAEGPVRGAFWEPIGVTSAGIANGQHRLISARALNIDKVLIVRP